MAQGVVSISGTPTQLQTLAANVTDVDGLPPGTAITYRWQQSSDGGTSWSDIAGAGAAALTLLQDQVAKLVRVVASYTDALGNQELVSSNATAAVTNVNDVGLASILGTPVQGWQLRASVADPDGLTNVAITYAWQQLIGSTWSDISGATGPTWTLQPAQAGRQVRVRVTYTDQATGSETNRTSPATPLIVAGNPAGNDVGVVSLSGTPTQNQTLAASVTDVDGLPAGTAVAYQWQQSSDGGATWTNIAGATASTLGLRQAQVGRQVRASVTYTDFAGNAGVATSGPTTAVANVNDVGVTRLTGTPVQGQALTGTVTDLDGLASVSITYRWQQLIGTTWSDIAGATGSSWVLQSAQVGRQVRLVTTYTDQLGGVESNRASAPTAAVIASPSSGPVTVFTSQTPSQPNFTDGPGVDWECGMRFVSDNAGRIEAIRYYKAAGETGAHVGRIWSSTGQLLASVTFTNETASGWQQQSLATPLVINAGTSYTVSVNVNNYYVFTSNGFSTAIRNGGLTAPIGAGVYDEGAGLYPALAYQNGNYFRDVVFVAGTSTNTPGVLGISGTPTQNQTLTASVTDADGVPGTVAYQWQQSSNGTTWSNIAGATARTLTLAQAQVGRFVRATAIYVDSRGSSESVISPATPSAVANVNDGGAVAINGTATQGQTLTASVSDPDGLPAGISYQWQSSADGITWSNVATGQSLVLGSGLVGQRLRVNATYVDLLGTNEAIVSAATAPVASLSSSPVTLFTSQTPSQPNFTDGPGVDWECGMRFVSDNAGRIEAIRYYKAAGETGVHVGRIWSSTGQQLASVTFTNETASGWQQQSLAAPLAINAGTSYTVSVNVNSHYALTPNGFSAAISNGGLTAPVGAGVYNDDTGVYPELVYQNENYFRDVVFTAGSTLSLFDNATIFVSETSGVAIVRVNRTGSTRGQMTLEYTTNEIGGVGAARAGIDYTPPTFNGRANTGQIVFADGESTKTFAIPIVNDTNIEGNETFSIGLQNPGPGGSLGVPRTVLVTIVDDDSPSIISVDTPVVSVSEATSTATITIQRSGSLAGTATVAFATSNGSALAGSDYSATSGVVTFAAGQSSQTISVPILNNTASEGNESFTIILSNPTGATLGSQTTATVNILDDDSNLGNLVRQTIVSGLNLPTALDWTSDGRFMFVAQKNGVVRVVDNGTLRSTPLIDLSGQVNDTGDRGLLGIAVNPNFATNPYVYLLYTYDPPETASRTGLAGPDGDGNRPSRLVRLTVNPNTMVADPASLVVLAGKNSNWAYTSRPDLDSTGAVDIAPSGIVNGTTIVAPADQIELGTQDNDPDRAGTQNQNIRDYLATDSGSHSIGAVHFGADGMLYLSNGDGTSFNFRDPRAVRVQDTHNLSGKVLRIDPVTGAGVAGNPFFNAADPNSNQSKVFYSGVRNAYRFTFDPTNNLPVVGDVGWNSWEEINSGPAGSNFGWPYLEGPNRTGGYQDLPQAISFYNNGNRNNPSDAAAIFPLLSRSHGAPDNAASITVGDFYNNDTLLFGDVLNGTIYAATVNASRQITNVQVFDSGLPNIVDIEKGPDGWLYGVDIGGTIKRWADPGVVGSGALLAAS